MAEGKSPRALFFPTLLPESGYSNFWTSTCFACNLRVWVTQIGSCRFILNFIFIWTLKMKYLIIQLHVSARILS